MTLKSKITLILLCIFMLFGVVYLGIQRFVIIPSFMALEHEEAITDVKRFVSALQKDIDTLDFFCWDWAAWDETYEFIETRSDAYIKANLVLETFADDDLNLLYFTNTSGKVIWGETRDRQTEITHLAEFPANALPADHPLLSYRAENKPLSEVKIAGIYKTSKGLMLIFSRPILTNQSQGPIRGSVIIGKYLTAKIIKKLADLTQVDFETFPMMDSALPEPLKNIPSRITDESRYLIESTGADYLHVYTTLSDIKGDTALLLKAKIPKNISAKGYASMRYAIYSFLAAGFGVLIVMLLLLHFSIFRPIKDFTNHVTTIGKTSDLSAIYSIKRRDEIGILANAFNGMLEQLKKFQDGLELMVKERTAELTTANERLYQEIKEREQAEEEARISEEKLARSKRMESLGLMAGGIAHDLNNIFAGIVSYPDLLLMDMSEENPLRKPMGVIKESAQRAADVVSELLTVARGVAAVKEVINLNTIIEEYLCSTENQQIELMNPSTTLITRFDHDLLSISCSAVHIKKCLLNLVVNAYESIEDCGNIIISTRNCYLDEPLAGYEDVRKGEYAILTVSDSGAGISVDDIERVFEPFYTKKVMGRSGTGLGLAIVWNTVKSHDGYINVNSSEDGTQFELFFPISRDELTAEKEQRHFEDYLGNGERILVIDDEQMQRDIACELLAKLGYSTEAVSSGEEAIEYLKKHSVELIVLDMIMPKGMNGRQTYEEIIKIVPNQKAVIASGFAETGDVKAVQKLGAGKYIKKPYTLEKIGITVKEEFEKQ
jgi:signal transduction histidine kinase